MRESYIVVPLFPLLRFAEGFANRECAECCLLMTHSRHVGVHIQVVIMTETLVFVLKAPDLPINNTEMPEKTNMEASRYP